MSPITILQIIVLILELIAKGASESEAISLASGKLRISEKIIRKFF